MVTFTLVLMCINTRGKALSSLSPLSEQHLLGLVSTEAFSLSTSQF